MIIEKRNFLPAPDHTWDGRALRKQHYKLTCIRNLGDYKLFVDKVWSGNGFGIDVMYYVVKLADGSIYRFQPPMTSSKVADIVAFLDQQTI